jgi:hypothetical protein
LAGRPLLEFVAKFQQVRARTSQFAGQPGGALALRHAAEDQHNLRARAAGLLKGGAGEEIEHPPACPAPPVQNRSAVASMHMQVLAIAAARAGQSGGMQPCQQPLVTGRLVHEIRQGEVHSSSVSKAGRYAGRAGATGNIIPFTFEET